MKNIERRRRREQKTDYKLRASILKSSFNRIIFRKTNRYIIGEYIKSNRAQDLVIIGVNSKELIKHGWKETYSIKNLAASYLTGLLLGKKILDKDKKAKAILDIGLQRNVKNSKIYAFLKGIVDSGVEVSCSKEILPKDELIKSKVKEKDIEMFNKIKEKISK